MLEPIIVSVGIGILAAVTFSSASAGAGDTCGKEVRRTSSCISLATGESGPTRLSVCAFNVI